MIPWRSSGNGPSTMWPSTTPPQPTATKIGSPRPALMWPTIVLRRPRLAHGAMPPAPQPSRAVQVLRKCLKHGWKFQSFMMNNKYETLLILTFTGNMCVRNQTKIMQRWPRQLPRLLDASSPQRVCPSVTVGGLIRGPAATRRLQLRWKSLNAFWCCNAVIVCIT